MILHFSPNAVEYSMTRDEMETAASLRERKSALMDELLRRAMAQNPDIASELIAVKTRQTQLIEADLHRRVEHWNRICEDAHRKRVAERHIRYDDRRNINKLSGIRRSCDYKYGTRLEQIEMEISEYYEPYHQPIPQSLIDERESILHPVSEVAHSA